MEGHQTLLKLFSLILVISSAILTSSVTTEDGRAKLNEFPFYVQIYNTKLKEFACSGAILNAYTIITVATCLERASFNPKYLSVTAGSNELREGDLNPAGVTTFAEGPQNRRGEGFVLHPGFQSDYNIEHNIALLYLKEPFHFNAQVQPISLPERGYSSGLKIGFGVKKEKVEGKYSPHLKKLFVDFTRTEQCQNLTRTQFGRDLNKAELCGVSHFSDVNVCVLDIGSPVICTWSHFSPPVLCGVDAITTNLMDCKDTSYGITSNIKEYLPWIQEAMNFITFKLKCNWKHFYCPSKHVCLPNELFCDGKMDCPLGEDEISCENLKSCQDDRFRCPNGKCYFFKRRCDGFNHCPENLNARNSEDEEKCAKDEICPRGLHSCGTEDRCITSDWQCDGVFDCLDGSDEEDCEPEEVKRKIKQWKEKGLKVKKNWRGYGEDHREENGACSRPVIFFEDIIRVL